MEAFIARQPIFGRDRNVYGYELLFRASAENVFGDVDGDFATASLISDSLHLHGLDSLTNGGKCFINLTRKALLDEVYAVLPPENTVVEILETVEPDSEVLDACRRVREAGYLLALDDYVLDPKFEPLLKLIDILKVEFPALTAEQQQSLSQHRKRHGFQLLAEKVEEHEEFQRAEEAGYKLFQGYFFCKPEVVRSRRLPASRMNYLRLLQALNDERTEVDELEQLIRQEVSLSYKLLRYLNSPGFGLRRGVTSIRHAITLMGQRPLKKWASLVAVNELNDEKPAELMMTCLTRARFCELLGERAKLSSSSSDLFMLGMFSLLDAMLDRPMKELVGTLALPDDVRDGLLDPSARLRPFIDMVIAFEHGDWPAITQKAVAVDIENHLIGESYRDALLWSSEIIRELAGADAVSSAPKAA